MNTVTVRELKLVDKAIAYYEQKAQFQSEHNDLKGYKKSMRELENLKKYQTILRN